MEIFAKQYWLLKIINFQCILHIWTYINLQNHQRWIITEWLWNFFETRSQNGPISVKWKHQSQLIFCILRLSHKHITFDTLKKHPVCPGLLISLTFLRYSWYSSSVYILTFLPWVAHNSATLVLKRHLFH